MHHWLQSSACLCCDHVISYNYLSYYVCFHASRSLPLFPSVFSTTHFNWLSEKSALFGGVVDVTKQRGHGSKTFGDKRGTKHLQPLLNSSEEEHTGFPSINAAERGVAFLVTT